MKGGFHNLEIEHHARWLGLSIIVQGNFINERGSQALANPTTPGGYGKSDAQRGKNPRNNMPPDYYYKYTQWKK